MRLGRAGDLAEASQRLAISYPLNKVFGESRLAWDALAARLSKHQGLHS